jgi:hypothetical protein
MPEKPSHPNIGDPTRLRRTGSRRRGGTVAPLIPSQYGGRERFAGNGGRVPGGYAWIVVIIAAGFAIWLQSRWMKEQKAKALDGTHTVANGFADKAAEWMLRKRGLAPEKATPGGGTASSFDRNDRRVDCVACEGLGAVYGDDGKARPCGVCQGVGYRMIRPFDAQDVVCSACGGMGRLETEGGGAETCPRCGGRGFVQQPPKEAEAEPAP